MGGRRLRPLLPGLEAYADSSFPAEYTPDFLTAKEADEFYAFFNDWHYCDYLIAKSGRVQKRKGVAFAVDPNHTQVRGTADQMNLAALGTGVMYGNLPSEPVDEDCNDSVLPLTRDENTPAVLRTLQQKLTAKLRSMPGYEMRTINYLSVIRYSDESVGIDWHKHSEDNGIDTPVLIVSTGATRE